uniref:Zinc finger protein 488 n=1 Tax=Aceria tosichella TaxID=561515 RepID=A0A6G1S8R7_9ACAR
MPKKQQLSSFNVDSILGLPSSQSDNTGHRRSPCQEQNITLPQMFNSNNFNNRMSMASGCGDDGGNDDWTIRYDLSNNNFDTDRAGLAQFGSQGLTPTHNAHWIKNPGPPMSIDGKTHDAYLTLKQPHQTHSQQPPSARPAIFNPVGFTPANDVAAPIMPSMAALATYSLFNWCAKCNCSFRMTSDLVHHMRTHHKRRQTGQND